MKYTVAFISPSNTVLEQAVEAGDTHTAVARAMVAAMIHAEEAGMVFTRALKRAVAEKERVLWVKEG